MKYFARFVKSVNLLIIKHNAIYCNGKTKLVSRLSLDSQAVSHSLDQVLPSLFSWLANPTDRLNRDN